MNLVSLMDLIAVFGSLSALLFILLGTRRSPWKPEITLFAFIIILTIGHDVGNFLEWTGVTNWFGPVEDYLEVLTAALWAFFLYTFLQEMTERDLRQVQELDEKILDGSPVAFVLHDLDMRIIRVSSAYRKVTGFKSEEVLGLTLEEFMPQGPQKDGIIQRIRYVREQRTQVGPQDIESPIPGRYLRETILPIFNAERKVVNTLSVLEDVTDVKLAVKALKQSEEKLRSSLIEKETLLREVHHRVKNNLQVISGLLNLQSRYIADEAVKSIYKESQNRIKTMALIHEELYQGTDLARINLAEYIMGLAENLTSSYSITRDRVRLVLDLEDEDMALDTAIPCGLMVNELMSNSLKHAFPGESEGEISIALHRLDGKKYSLSVSDNGIGLPRGLDYRKTGTMGMQLVVVLAEQLGADLEYDGETGTSFTITFNEYHEASPDVV